MSGEEDILRLAADLGKASRKAITKADKVVRKAALDAQRYMQRTDGVGAPRDTGTLANSIQVESQETIETIEASAVANVEYAHYVAYGTRYQRPNPFDMRAAEAIAPQFVKAIEDIGDGIL